jgi:hypothetical protein
MNAQLRLSRTDEKKRKERKKEHGKDNDHPFL